MYGCIVACMLYVCVGGVLPNSIAIGEIGMLIVQLRQIMGLPFSLLTCQCRHC